jgi:hypothetical protein
MKHQNNIQGGTNGTLQNNDRQTSYAQAAEYDTGRLV